MPSKQGYVLKELLDLDLEITYLERDVNKGCYIVVLQDARRVKVTIGENAIKYELGDKRGKINATHTDALENYKKTFPYRKVRGIGINKLFGTETAYEYRLKRIALIQLLRHIPEDTSFKAKVSGYLTDLEIDGVQKPIQFHVHSEFNANEVRVPLESGTLKIGEERFGGLHWNLLKDYVNYVQKSLAHKYPNGYPIWEEIQA